MILKNKMKILAGIVSFNRESLLKRCVENIFKQTLKVDLIYIVNHGLILKDTYFYNNKKIIVYNQTNEGSAGGWYKIIEYFTELNFDYMWLMDDDGFPDIHALYNLVNIKNLKFSCVSSIVINENYKNKFVFPMPKLNKNNLPSIINFKRKHKNLKSILRISKNNLYPYAHLFNGALFSSHIISIVGNVNKNYFMYGDELDYFYRLKKIAPVYSVLNAFHFHPDVTLRKCSDNLIYYYIKNSFILNRKYLSYSNLRNIGIYLLSIQMILFRNGFFNLIKFFFNPRLILFKSVLRGYRDKLGNDIDE